MSWDGVFWCVAPHLLMPFADSVVKVKISEAAAAQAGAAGQGQQPTLDDQIFQTLKIQFMALGLVIVESMRTVEGNLALFWTLTSRGKDKLLLLRSVRSAIQPAISTDESMGLTRFGGRFSYAAFFTD